MEVLSLRAQRAEGRERFPRRFVRLLALALAPAVWDGGAEEATPPDELLVPPEHLADNSIVSLAQDRRERLVIIATNAPKGVALLDGEKLVPLVAEPVAGGAVSRDDLLFFIQGEEVWMLDLARPDKKEKVTASFGGPPAGSKAASCTPDGSVWVEGCPKRRLPHGAFADVPPGPEAGACFGVRALDNCGNFWALSAAHGGGERQVLVLPAQKPSAWTPAADPEMGAKAGSWRSLIAADEEEVWVAGARTLRCLNLRQPEQGWSLGTADGLPEAELTALGLSPDGRALAGFADGRSAVCYRERDGKKTAQVLPPPRTAAGPVRAVFTDGSGATWRLIGNKLHRTPASPEAWQRGWRQAASLPHPNHDITGAELNGKFYIAGGAVKAYGYPAGERTHDGLWAYDPARDAWTLAGRFRQPRFFCALAAFEGKLWVIGGALSAKAPATDLVEVFDPKSGEITAGPPLSGARPCPLAAVLNGRLYALGDDAGKAKTGALMESLGAGETAWRKESAAPVSLGTAAGCVLDGAWYVRPAGKGFLVYEARAGKWDESFPAPPELPRAPAMAAWDSAVWMVGGRALKEGRATYRLVPKDRAWTASIPLPRENAWAAGGTAGGRMLVSGGAFERVRQQFLFSNRVYLFRGGAPPVEK